MRHQGDKTTHKFPAILNLESSAGSGVPRSPGSLGCPPLTPPVEIYPTGAIPVHPTPVAQPPTITITTIPSAAGAGLCTNPSCSCPTRPYCGSSSAGCGSQYQATATMHGNHTVCPPPTFMKKGGRTLKKKSKAAQSSHKNTRQIDSCSQPTDPKSCSGLDQSPSPGLRCRDP
jgi:hypothetical protein